MRPYPQEQLLIEQLGDLAGDRVLCTSPGLAQFAQATARERPQASVHCHYIDLHHSRQALEALANPPANLTIGCAADFPENEVDLAAFPFSTHGEAELTREMMQAGYRLLAVGGQMIVSTDNPRDKWLHEEMQKLFSKVVRRPAAAGTVYVGRKREQLKKVKNFAAELVFRDRDQLIRAYSRPGVFSHRRVDPGARQLISAMEVAEGSRVLDIGCGAGVVALAAARRAPTAQVQALDSNARAIECTQKGAQLNGLTNVGTSLNASGDVEGQGTFDLVLGNPPYYAAFQIARLFATAGRAALRPGGRILMVTKSPEWYVENMPNWFDGVKVERSRDYHLVSALKAG